MSGRKSRDKGARGEREVAELLNGRRTGQMQSQEDSSEADVEAGEPLWNEAFHTEVKRQERLQMNRWHKQAAADAAEKIGHPIPLVVYRSNGEPWRVSLDMNDFLFLWKYTHSHPGFPAAISDRL